MDRGRDRRGVGDVRGRIALLAALAVLAGAAACRERFEGYEPAVDPALATSFDAAEIDFEASEPPLVEQHRMDLLRRFAEHGAPLDRGDGFPPDWNKSSIWSVGEMNSTQFGFRYVKADPFVFCFGNVDDQLGWSSSAAPEVTHWIEERSARNPQQSSLRFDAALVGSTVVLVRESRDGLQEIDFEAAGGALEERSRRLVREKGEDPMLLPVGSELLFLWREFTRESTALGGGLAFRVAHRGPESDGWSEAQTLTVAGGAGSRPALACRGDQVAVAWPDNRYARIQGLGLGRTSKLFVATSPDRGRTWSVPRCVQDPSSQEDVFGRITLLSCGERWLLTIQDDTSPRHESDTLAFSRDLTHWSYLPGEHHDELIRAAVGRLTHD